jgi:16S rRNA (cytosine1402-N4)-methyltransferase
VLLHELVDAISIQKNNKNIIVDATLGMAWHAKEIIAKMNPWDTFIWFDADEKNLQAAKQRLESLFPNSKVHIVLIHSNFVHLKDELKKRNIEEITGIYYDLWISSLHVDEAERGFSFKLNGPLDMRFDKSAWKTAADIVNSFSERELKNIFSHYWEEPKSYKIAAKIVEKRKQTKFTTTKQLSDTIEEVSKDPKSKNRIFQALRIETNNELEHIKVSLKDAIELLEKDGTIFVISFHSLEDRITKQIFKKETRDCICSDLICSCHHKKCLQLLSKKPILPSKKEVEYNQRSRSAKARSAQKII